MPKGSRYSTRQRSAVLACLKARAGQYLTAAETAEAIRSESDTPVGLTTIYRTLENLKNEGLVRKFVLDKTSPAAYEYLENPLASEFHVRCQVCGRLFHLRCAEIERMASSLSSHLLADHGVELDLQSSVIQGICRDCRTARSALAQNEPLSPLPEPGKVGCSCDRAVCPHQES